MNFPELIHATLLTDNLSPLPGYYDRPQRYDLFATSAVLTPAREASCYEPINQITLSVIDNALFDILNGKEIEPMEDLLATFGKFNSL
jgi:hypothetical protein